MFWQKVEHNLKFIFLLLLVFTQALVFVAVGAKDSDKMLKVSLLSPIAGQNIKAGGSIDLEAYLENKDALDFSLVYFNISNPDISYSQNFEANKSTSGTWKASSSWETSNLPTGNYWLSVQADVYSNGNVENYYSNGQLIIVSGVDYQMAAELLVDGPVANEMVFSQPEEKQVVSGNTLDILLSSGVALGNVVFTVKEWNESEQSIGEAVMSDISPNDLGGSLSWGSDLDISSLENGYYIILASADTLPLASGSSISAEVVFSVSRQSEIIIVSGTINSPTPNQNISGEFLAKTTLNRSLNLANGENKVVLKISNSDAQLLSKTNLESSDADGLVYQKNINSVFLGMDGEPLYPDGNYNCEFIVETTASSISLGSVNIFIDNEPDELELAEQVVLNSPAIASVISEDSFVVDISTLVPFAGAKVQFYQSTDPAISSDNIDIPLVDGYHWIQTISLDDSFVDGDYILSLTFYEQETGALFGALDYQLKLSRQSAENNIDPDNIRIKLLNLESNISGTKSPVVLSNFEFSSGDIFLEISKSADNSELGQLSLIRASWSTLASLGFYQGDYSDTPYGYLVSLDSNSFANGNYNIVAKSNLNAQIASETKLISIFNTSSEEIEEEEQEDASWSTSTDEIVPDDLTEQDELTNEQAELGNEAQEQAIEANKEENKNQITIRLSDSCLDLGIDNENDCLRFRAMAQSLDERCLSQSIFEILACEDYLNRLEVDLECQTEGIIEKEGCKDYLLEKYGANVSCRLADSSVCNDVLRNSYLNRLVVAQKNQIAINQFLLPLVGTSVSTQELSDKADNLDLGRETLSLVGNTETKVFLAPSQSEAILADKDILTILGQAVMLLDSDGDFLPDDLESYYGTDKNNPDSDNDSYLDSTEIQNNYNPLGNGALSQERLSLEKVLLGKMPLEQPKPQSEKIDSSLDLRELESLESRLRLRGQAQPNTWLTIYLYSDLPLAMLVKTDENGDWSYDITQTITDGYHQIYVASSDESGKIIKQSRPVSFLVKSAQAVTADDYFGPAINLEEPKSFLIYYMGAGALLILGILSLVIFARKNKRAI